MKRTRIPAKPFCVCSSDNIAKPVVASETKPSKLQLANQRFDALFNSNQSFNPSILQ